jgi:hypothetical protein
MVFYFLLYSSFHLSLVQRQKIRIIHSMHVGDLLVYSWLLLAPFIFKILSYIYWEMWIRWLSFLTIALTTAKMKELMDREKQLRIELTKVINDNN